MTNKAVLFFSLVLFCLIFFCYGDDAQEKKLKPDTSDGTKNFEEMFAELYQVASSKTQRFGQEAYLQSQGLIQEMNSNVQMGLKVIERFSTVEKINFLTITTLFFQLLALRSNSVLSFMSIVGLMSWVYLFANEWPMKISKDDFICVYSTFCLTYLLAYPRFWPNSNFGRIFYSFAALSFFSQAYSVSMYILTDMDFARFHVPNDIYYSFGAVLIFLLICHLSCMLFGPRIQSVPTNNITPATPPRKSRNSRNTNKLSNSEPMFSPNSLRKITDDHPYKKIYESNAFKAR